MTDIINVGFKRLTADATLPTKAHASDSGFDLYAAEDVIIEPGETKVIPTDIAVLLPKGYEATVRPRSGVTAKTKLRVQIGTIDNGYNGDIGVIIDNSFSDIYAGSDFMITLIDGREVDNRSDEFNEIGTYLIRKGDRIAQLVVHPLPSVEAYEITGDIGATDRGASGYGSTGVRDRHIKDSIDDNREALSKLVEEGD